MAALAAAVLPIAALAQAEPGAGSDPLRWLVAQLVDRTWLATLAVVAGVMIALVVVASWAKKRSGGSGRPRQRRAGGGSYGYYDDDWSVLAGREERASREDDAGDGEGDGDSGCGGCGGCGD